MNYKELLNSAAKWGLGLGLLMALSRILESKWIISATVSNMTLLTFEWVFVATIYVLAIYRANKLRAASQPAEVGYRFSQSLNFTILISIFVAVIVGIASHIYIVNFIGGYDIFLEESISSIVTIMSENDMSNETATALLDQSRESAELVKSDPPTIIGTIFSTISTYILSGFVVGLGVAALTQRRATQINNEQ